MGALMRSYDWSLSPLGPPAGWPVALKLAVATCLSSRFPMVIWWGPQLLMLYNDAWQPILGDTKHPAGLGRPGAESWPETWPIVGVQFENALKGVASWFEDLLLASDRHGFLEECYFTYSHSPLRDASGDVVGVHSVVSETTTRVLNERRLLVLRDLSNATVEATTEQRSLPELCRIWVERLCTRNPDVPFAVLYLIDGAGRARRTACAGVDAARFPAEVERTDAWGIAKALRGRIAVETDVSKLPAPLPGGVWPERTTQVVVLPLSRSDSGTDLCGAVLTGINARLRLDDRYLDFLRLVSVQLAGAVSGLQLMESERASRAEAVRATRLKDEFLAVLSHELRTPLNAVLGWTQLLKSELGEPARVEKAIEVIERNAHLQMRLINDLLDLSRVTSGNLTLDLHRVELASLVDAAVESILPVATAKGVRIERSLHPVPGPIEADPERVQQMLWNLLANAVEFTTRGGRIEISIVPDRDRARISVSDDGEGIEPAFLPHVFERFRQGDPSRARRHGGLGLGLALVKQLAELHGGAVHAASPGRGAGSTFVLELPLAAQTGVRGAARPAQPGNAAAGALFGLRVLAVDDQPDGLALIAGLLESRGARVRTASTAEAAFTALAGKTFDAIVSDVAMPGLDGYDFVRELRKRGVETPAVAVTALALPEDRARALAAGFQALLPKPVDADLLVATLARLCATRA
jgi:signal transduction histidine kinase